MTMSRPIPDKYTGPTVLGNRRGFDGVATLTMTVLLLFIATLSALALARLGTVEQRMSGVDVRTREVETAATSALEYGLDWFERHAETLVWSDADGDGRSCAGDRADLPGLAAIDLEADTYRRAVAFELNHCLDAPGLVVTLEATAAALGDSHVERTVRTDVLIHRQGVFSELVTDGRPTRFEAPPLVVEDCLHGIGGNADAEPVDGISLATTAGTPDCLSPDSLELEGGAKARLSEALPLWRSLFRGENPTRVKANLKRLERRNPDRVLVVDADYPRHEGQPDWNGNRWHHNLGNREAPAILYFDSAVGCPVINGGPVIVGLVYIEARGCTDAGMRNGTLYGTLALAGDAGPWSSSATLIGETLDFSEDREDSRRLAVSAVELRRVIRLPASWRDF